MDKGDAQMSEEESKQGNTLDEIYSQLHSSELFEAYLKELKTAYEINKKEEDALKKNATDS